MALVSLARHHTTLPRFSKSTWYDFLILIKWQNYLVVLVVLVEVVEEVVEDVVFEVDVAVLSSCGTRIISGIIKFVSDFL